MYYRDQFGWIRIFGRGIKFKHIKHGLLFSERMGITKPFKIGNWIISFIGKDWGIDFNKKNALGGLVKPTNNYHARTRTNQ